MMTSPTEPLTTAIPSASATAALDGIAETCGQLRLLLQEAQSAALDRDGDDLAEACEKIRPLQAELTRRYQTWLARRAAPARAQMSDT